MSSWSRLLSAQRGQRFYFVFPGFLFVDLNRGFFLFFFGGRVKHTVLKDLGTPPSPASSEPLESQHLAPFPASVTQPCQHLRYNMRGGSSWRRWGGHGPLNTPNTDVLGESRYAISSPIKGKCIISNEILKQIIHAASLTPQRLQFILPVRLKSTQARCHVSVAELMSKCQQLTPQAFIGRNEAMCDSVYKKNYQIYHWRGHKTQ